MIIQLSLHSIITIKNHQLSNCRIVDNPDKLDKMRHKVFDISIRSRTEGYHFADVRKMISILIL